MGKVLNADFSADAFEPTDDLDEIGWQKWDELSDRARSSGLVNAADLLTFYCQFFSKRKRCEDEITAHGLMQFSDKGGQRSHALNQVSIQLTIELRQLTKALGFDIKDVGKTDNAKEKKARRLLD